MSLLFPPFAVSGCLLFCFILRVQAFGRYRFQSQSSTWTNRGFFVSALSQLVSGSVCLWAWKGDPGKLDSWRSGCSFSQNQMERRYFKTFFASNPTSHGRGSQMFAPIQSTSQSVAPVLASNEAITLLCTDFSCLQVLSQYRIFATFLFWTNSLGVFSSFIRVSCRESLENFK